MMKSNLNLLLLLYILGLFARPNKTSQIEDLNIKYLTIDKQALVSLSTSDSSPLVYKLFNLENNRVELNTKYFRISEQFDANETYLYGLDLSNSNIDNERLDLIVNENPDLFDSIKCLNLSGNQLKSWDLSSRLMNNLEVLILDRNKQFEHLNLSFKNLKILSLNKCNLNENWAASILSLSNIAAEQKLIYLGLSDNKLTDMTNEHKLLSLIDALLPTQVDMLDLSHNKLSKLEVVKYVLKKSFVKKLNLERNLLSQFDMNELGTGLSSIEINLRFNFIRNTSLVYFQVNNLSGDVKPKYSVKLHGNPLVCDCNSMWLLEEVKKNLERKQQLVLYKRRKSSAYRKQSPANDTIKLIFKRKREMEKISSHYLLDDPNFEMYMQRQKRLKFKGKIDEPLKEEEALTVKIIDLESLSCSFIDVQNQPQNTTRAYSAGAMSLSPDLNKQNFYVNSIQYREKEIISSNYGDYMCLYEDHCQPNECDCCVFRHCHCRAICPRQCRCYFDANLRQNIVDCSSLNLIEVPLEKSESATDMRLNSNSLKLLKSHSFFGFGKLKYLYLQDNQISYITSDSFDDLKNSLTMLNLAGNRLSYLNGDEFNGLKELTVLILNKNPLKDIENIYFIHSANLPSLKLFYIYETKLLDKKQFELINYSTEFSNVSILNESTEKVVPQAEATSTSTVRTTISFFDLSNLTRENVINKDASLHTRFNFSQFDYNESPQQMNQTKLINKFFNRFKLFNWYHFPMLVLVVCLILSLFIVFTVVVVARKLETDNRAAAQHCLKSEKTVGVVDIGGAAFLSSNYSSNLNTIQSEDEDDSSTRFMLERYCTCIGGSGCKLKRAYDSCDDCYSSSNRTNFDSSTVAVSRSIENLSLNVYIYFNVIDSDYVLSHLQPLLRKCLTIVPDTKYITKPQTGKHVVVTPDSFFSLEQTNMNTLLSDFNNSNVQILDTNSTESGQLLLKSNTQNCLIANILVISDHFYGYKPMVDSLVSLTKTSKVSGHSSGGSSSGSGTSTSSSSGASHVNNKTSKCLMLYAENSLKNAFKIYMNLNQNENPTADLSRLTNTKQQQQQPGDKYIFNSTKTYSLNQRLMKRIYESSNSKSFYSSDMKVAAQIESDMLSSHAHHERLQSKLEKYLQQTCLKSNKFSNNNFSYVDYTKR